MLLRLVALFSLLFVLSVHSLPRLDEVRNNTRLLKVLHRLEVSDHLRYMPWMTKAGRSIALLNAMHSDPEMKRAMVEEPRKLGLSSCYKQSNVMPFPCKPFAMNRTRRAASVHSLTPADIEVVGAIGDSLSSGTGIDACTVIGLLVEYRGRVFSIGGNDNVEKTPTLANMLRLYNPNLMGFSVGRSGYKNVGKSRFNVANPGDNSLQLQFQTELLVQRMKEGLSEDQFKNSWKMVTIFIGNNDICDFCDSEELTKQLTPELYRQRLQTSLDYLHANLPRTLVNLVTLLDTVLVQRLNEGLVCSALHYYTCKCAAFAKDPAAIKRFNDAFQHELYDLVKTGRYDHDPFFTVVVQPFFQDTTLPLKSDGSPDLSFFAPDCFHFSFKGHAATAQALWNAMFEPVGAKKTSWVLNEPFECPDAQSPYIRTAKN